MQALLGGAPLSRGAGQDTGQGSGTVRGEPAEQSRLPALAGLDPVVVEAARKAGVPEDQLVRMSRLAGQGELRPKAKGKPRVPLGDPLDESDDGLDAEGGGAALTLGDPVSQAVVQIGQVLKAMQRERERKNDLEDVLERADTSAGILWAGAPPGAARNLQPTRNFVASFALLPSK